MMSNSVPESEKEILTGCVSFYAQWFDVCVALGFVGSILFGRPNSAEDHERQRLATFGGSLGDRRALNEKQRGEKPAEQEESMGLT